MFKMGATPSDASNCNAVDSEDSSASSSSAEAEPDLSQQTLIRQVIDDIELSASDELFSSPILPTMKRSQEFSPPRKKQKTKAPDCGSSQSVWSDRIKFTGGIPGVDQVHLPPNMPLNSDQQKQFWNIVLTSINSNVAQHSLPQVVANTWNTHHFAKMSENVVGFGGQMSQGHAEKLLKEKGNQVCLQQHHQINFLKQSHDQAVAQFPTAAPVASAPVVATAPSVKLEQLTRENTESFTSNESGAWLRKLHLPMGRNKMLGSAELNKHPDRKEKENN